MNPVVIAATGGLGNQLFQFAAALAISDASGAPVKTCCRMYDRPWHRRAFLAMRRWYRSLGASTDERFRLRAMQRRPDLLDLLPDVAETTAAEEVRFCLSRDSLKRAFAGSRGAPEGMCLVRTVEEVERLVSDDSGHHGKPGLHRPVLVAGHMQGDRLVAPRADRIRSMVRLPHSSPYLDAWMPVASGEDSVAIHVRRGDYLKPAYRDSFPILPASWFSKAVHLLQSRHGRLRFIVVSDDPAWVRTKLSLQTEIHLACGSGSPSALEDLALIAACKHHVISNSTFSWWGARLGNRGGDTVAPTLWEFGRTLSADFLPDGWIALSNPPTRD
jgi:hypothetical protein